MTTDLGLRGDLRRGTTQANPWLAWALHLAHLAGEARGWQPVTRQGMQRVLVTLLSGHRDGEVIAASAVRGRPPAQHQQPQRHRDPGHDHLREVTASASTPRSATPPTPGN